MWNGARGSTPRVRLSSSPGSAMVEYAMIVAHSAISLIPKDVLSWLSQLHWESLGYASLALLTVGFAVWAFRPTH